MHAQPMCFAKRLFTTNNNLKHVAKQMQFNDSNWTSFERTKTLHLWRSAIILKFCSNHYLVNNSMMFFKISQKLFGERIVSAMMKLTFYGQFCIGNNQDKVKSMAIELRRENILPMLLVTTEEESKSQSLSDEESWFTRNKDEIIQCISINSGLSSEETTKFTQFKLTSLVSSTLLEKLTTSLNKLRKVSSIDDKPVAIALEHLHSILNDDEQIADDVGFTQLERNQFKEGIQRIKGICEASRDLDVCLFVDAEYTKINPAIRVITHHMMALLNQHKPLVQHTYQAYLKGSSEEVQESLTFCRENDIYFGAKVVRGAYMVFERQQAAKEGTKDPVWGSWGLTNDNYNKIVSHVIETIGTRLDSKIGLTVATHNEESINIAIEQLNKHNIDPASGRVNFAQIYGLSDYVTNWLAKNGFVVYKSAPIGSVTDTLPYLWRRALENNSVMDVRKDRDLLKRELRRRWWVRPQG